MCQTSAGSRGRAGASSVASLLWEPHPVCTCGCSDSEHSMQVGTKVSLSRRAVDAVAELGRHGCPPVCFCIGDT